MTITASQVKELRDRSGAGMMECKKALVETGGDVDAAQELLRKSGAAQADKKAGRIAAEGRIDIVAGETGDVALIEVNSETDFVARDENFVAFAQASAEAALGLDENERDVEVLLSATTRDGASVEQARRDLVAKVGENINVRRFEVVRPTGQTGSYLHGSRIGVIVDVTGGDDALRKDIAMHIAASAPEYVSDEDVPTATLDKERHFLTEQAEQEGKPDDIVAKMVDGRLRKFIGEITLLGQPFVKDPDVKVAKLLKDNGATVNRFIRFEVGEGIEKKAENFAEEVQATIQNTD